jgi:hypothetical protein
VVDGAVGEFDCDVEGGGELAEVVGGLLVCVAVVVVSVTVEAVLVKTTVVLLFPDCLLANSSRLCATTAFS